MEIQEAEKQRSLLPEPIPRPDVPERLTATQAKMILHEVAVCWAAQDALRAYLAATVRAAWDAGAVLQGWDKHGPLWSPDGLAEHARLFASLEKAARDAVSMGRLFPLGPALTAISHARPNA